MPRGGQPQRHQRAMRRRREDATKHPQVHPGRRIGASGEATIRIYRRKHDGRIDIVVAGDRGDFTFSVDAAVARELGLALLEAAGSNRLQ
jgi:hypothetical protein